jgi:hypothetical protein
LPATPPTHDTVPHAPVIRAAEPVSAPYAVVPVRATPGAGPHPAGTTAVAEVPTTAAQSGEWELPDADAAAVAELETPGGEQLIAASQTAGEVPFRPSSPAVAGTGGASAGSGATAFYAAINALALLAISLHTLLVCLRRFRPPDTLAYPPPVPPA